MSQPLIRFLLGAVLLPVSPLGVRGEISLTEIAWQGDVRTGEAAV